MRLFRKRLHIKDELKSISIAAQTYSASRYTEDGFVSHQPYVEAQTYVSNTDWESVRPPWMGDEEKVEKALQTLEPMIAQKLAKRHRGTTDIHFVEREL